MLVVHGTYVGTKDGQGSFFLWGESPTVDQTRQAVRRGGVAPYPYQASPDDLKKVLRPFVSGADRFVPKSLTFMFPTVGGRPQASSPLVSDDSMQEHARLLFPHTVDGMDLRVEEAVRSLLLLGKGDAAEEGYTSGSDLLFWSAASKLLLELLARQRFIPYLARDGYRAVWRPLLHDFVDRVGFLTDAMPPVCRAVEGMDDSDLLVRFLSDGTDALVRGWLPRDTGQDLSDSVDARWLRALLSGGSVTAKEGRALEAALGSWAREVYSPVGSPGQFRTCFRLDPPDEATRGRPEKAPWALRYFLQAADDPSLIIPLELVWKESPKVARLLKGGPTQEMLLADLGKAARLSRAIDASLRSSPAPSHHRMSLAEAYSFLNEDAWLLQESGFGVLVPPWWRQGGSQLKVKVTVKPPDTGKVKGTGIFTLGTLLDFDWKAAVGAVTLSEREFMDLVALKVPLVNVRGRWVELKRDEIDSALKLLESYRKNGGMPLSDAIRMAAVGGEALDGGSMFDTADSQGWIKEVIGRVSGGDAEGLPPARTPKGFKGVMRPYQLLGLSWLRFMGRWGLGACLADDMGLGKTIQSIALLLENSRPPEARAARPSLVICPTSVVGNWQRELQRFAPSLKVVVHHGAGRLRGDKLVADAAKHDVVVSSYSLLQRDADVLSAIKWEVVVLDEAQSIKNRWTKQAKAAARLAARQRMALTGTPVENRLSELWSIMDFLNPGFLGELKEFKRNYAVPIERYGEEEARDRLRKLVRPFILRRLKTDRNVIGDLPEKMEMKVFCNLTEEQTSLYQAYVKQTLSEIEGAEGIQRKGLVLKALTRLKQICDHPALFAADSSKLDGRSGKAERLKEMLEEVVAEGDRALVFTQYAGMGEMLKGYVQSKLGCEVLFLYGAVPQRKRDQMVARFQATDGPRVFVVSLRAGGLGLNLTGANHVFHFDRWWNPAVENQATDRAFRIGQTKNVQVHKLISIGTLEEKIDRMIERKKGLAEKIVGAGESWLTEMSTEELRETLSLRQTGREEG